MSQGSGCKDPDVSFVKRHQGTKKEAPVVVVTAQPYSIEHAICISSGRGHRTKIK